MTSNALPSPDARYTNLPAVGGFQALEGVREGLLVSEPVPMFLGIETIATALAP